MSVPVLLLWNVQITVRRKLILGAILCLSIFMILIAIIRVSTGKNSNGQVDSAWVIFWLQAEASVAIVVVSMSAFRALFIAHKASRYQRSPEQGASSRTKLWSRRMNYRDNLPSAPSPAYDGIGTRIQRSFEIDEPKSKYDDLEMLAAREKGDGLL